MKIKPNKFLQVLVGVYGTTNFIPPNTKYLLISYFEIGN